MRNLSTLLHDIERVAGLDIDGIPEGRPAPALDRIVVHAAIVCRTERASITLIDRDRQTSEAS